MRPIAAVLLVLSLSAAVRPSPATAGDVDRYFARGRVELASDAPAAVPDARSARSPRTSFLLSLLLPGAGQWYLGAKGAAAGFLATEALTWTAWAYWRGKGSDEREVFRAFADLNWDESRYREWQSLNRSLGSPYIETETLPSKEEDTQQYYELIGKYNQFVFGWADVDVPLTADNELIRQIESTRRLDYETMRNESNKYLKRASVVIGLAVVNHVVSAIHASAQARTLARAAERRLWVEVVPFAPSGRAGLTTRISSTF